jgi:integrase
MSGDGKSPTFAKIPTLAFGKLIKSCGDKPVTAYRRADVHTVVSDMLASGNSTSTVRRQLNSLVAAFALAIREKELEFTNPFAKALIPGEGKDTENREVFTDDEFKALGHRVDQSGKRDDLWHMLGLLMDTGARLAEIVGLLVSDVVLDGPVPYLNMQYHPHRRLKNDDSIRRVPLTGRALDSARKAVAHAATVHSAFLFSRYTDKASCRTAAASQTLNNRIESLRIDKTCHCLRHTMRDRLRAVQCTEAVMDRIGGWKTAGVGVSYGNGYPLEVLQEWLARAVSWPEPHPKSDQVT